MSNITGRRPTWLLSILSPVSQVYSQGKQKLLQNVLDSSSHFKICSWNPSYFLSGPLVRVLEEAWRYFTEEITSGKLSRVSCPQTGTFVWSSLSHTQDPSFLSLSISPGTRPSQGNCCRDTSGAPLAILTLHNDTPTEMHNWMYESSKVSFNITYLDYY